MFKNRKIVLKILLLLVTAILAGPFAFGCLADQPVPYYSPGNDKTDQLSNTITVTGRGSYKVVPDKVMVNISIFIEDETSQKAVDKNSKTTAEVVEALENLGIEDIRIQTVSFNLDPLYNYRRKDEPPEVYAFRATTVMEVSTLDIMRIGEIIAEAIDAGVNDVSSLRFGLSDELEREAKKNALEEAALDGKNKAEDIADSLGINIVDIYYISESETHIPAPLMAREFAADEAVGGVSAVPITPNEVEVTASVQISYIFR
jgi:uncharacterized protein YggE